VGVKRLRITVTRRARGSSFVLLCCIRTRCRGIAIRYGCGFYGN